MNSRHTPVSGSSNSMRCASNCSGALKSSSATVITLGYNGSLVISTPSDAMIYPQLVGASSMRRQPVQAVRGYQHTDRPVADIMSGNCILHQTNHRSRARHKLGWLPGRLQWKPEWRVPKSPHDAAKRENGSSFSGWPVDACALRRRSNMQVPGNTSWWSSSSKPPT